MYALMTLLAHTLEAGVSAAARGLGRARSTRAVHKAEPRTCADLIAQAGALGSDAAPRAGEVNAEVALGPSGPVTAPLSGLDCAWYLVRVHERFRTWRPGPLGPRRAERGVKVAEQASGRVTIQDHTATVRVHPVGATFSLGAPSYSAFEARVGGDGSLMDQVTGLLGVALQPRHGPMTLGFTVEEWVLRQGDGLHVVGAAHSEDGEVVLAKPAMRPFVISATPGQAGAPTAS